LKGMAQHDLQALVARLKADGTFRAKLMATENMAECMEQIFAHGYSCTAAEVRQGLEELRKNESDTCSITW